MFTSFIFILLYVFFRLYNLRVLKRDIYCIKNTKNKLKHIFYNTIIIVVLFVSHEQYSLPVYMYITRNLPFSRNIVRL